MIDTQFEILQFESETSDLRGRVLFFVSAIYPYMYLHFNVHMFLDEGRCIFDIDEADLMSLTIRPDS